MFTRRHRRSVSNKIAICHQTITVGDAIGNDILGMYGLFANLGFEPELVCEYPHEAIRTGYRTTTDLRGVDLTGYGVVIYHHSIFWQRGEELLDRSLGNVVVRYHNITPPEFFRPYSVLYAKKCAQGREQTRRLVVSRAPQLWLAASTFNRCDLLEMGARDDRVLVVPPFSRVDELLPQPNRASYDTSEPVSALFVGRLAPNKGHLTMVRIVHAYARSVSADLKLRMVGARDTELRSYESAVWRLIEELGLEHQVEMLPYLPQEQLDELFRTSHIYLCASHHEGFGVPLIEAQAVGLPIVATSTTAKAETVGPRQLLAEPPCSEADYEFYAGLIEELRTSSELRGTLVRNGYRNVIQRFVREEVENTFLGVVLPLMRAAE